MNNGAPSRAGTRDGFTLIELLVVVALIAVLAAVLFPTVTGTITGGDRARAESTLDNLQTGVEMFQVDIRITPGGVSDLSRNIGVDSLGTITDEEYTQTEVGRWMGPYLDTPVEAQGNATSTDLSIGFGSDLCNDFFIVSADTTTDEGWTTSANGSASGCQDFTNSGGSFAAVAADSMNLRNFEMIDDAVDDGDGPDRGKARLMGTDDDNLLVFLLVPVLPRERNRQNQNPVP